MTSLTALRRIPASASEHCHYTLVGENAMGKILTVLRDNNGKIDYDIKYPLFLFEHEIK